MGSGTFLQSLSDKRRLPNPDAPTGPIDPSTVADPEQNLTQRIHRGLELWFDVGAKVNQMVVEAKADRRALYERLERQTPVMYRRTNSGVVDSGGDPLVLSLGHPEQGFYWEVQSVFLGGTESNVAATGTAGLYVTALVPTASATPGCNYQVDRAPYQPAPGFYGGREVYVGPAEHLVAVIFGGTVGQTYVANMCASVFNIAAGGGRVTGLT